MPNHVMDPEELMAHLDGELPADRAAAAAEHLHRCRECQDLAADFESVSRRMLAWQVEPPAEASAPAIASTLAACPPLRKSRRTAWRWLGGLTAAALAALLLITAQHPIQVADQQAAPANERALTSYANAPAESRSAAPAPAPAPEPPQIARTAQLTLTIRDVDEARASMEDILKHHGGYIGELTAKAPSDSGHTLKATLRIPADHLTAALAELKKLGHVESESQTGEEVTQQVVDLEARLANSRNTEQRLTALLKQQTGKLADVLQVETEISRVRGEIERMESERKALAKRVDFATVNVTLAEDYKAKLQLAPDSTLTRFRNAAVEGFRNMVDSLSGLAIFLLSAGPSLLLWGAILFFPTRWLWRKTISRRAGRNPNILPRQP